MSRHNAHPVIQQLYTYRIMIGRNITEVAEDAHVNRTTISKAELGFQNPGIDVVSRWANALGFKLVLEDLNTDETTGD